jgi:menaquinone-specific isochorismate synthase
VVRTVSLELPAEASLIDLLPEDHPVTWLRRGDGLVGCGVAAEIRTSGAERFAEANAWWRELTARAIVRSDVDEPGSGLVAFGTFAFSDEPAHDPAA